MLGYYSHKEVILVSHSLSGYLSLLYTITYKHKVFNIKELILLSPVGITSK
jgi:pimeloyl-ACP methyl ester carboxylesterase